MTYRQHVAQQDRRHREFVRRSEVPGLEGLSPFRSEAQALTTRPSGLPDTAIDVVSGTYERTGSAFGAPVTLHEES